MLQTILQEAPPQDLMELITRDPVTTIAVIVLWAFGAMYGFWAITGKQNVPRMIFVLTFFLIFAIAFMLTFYLSPDMFGLARTNFVQFIIALVGSAAFGIIILPLAITMGIGAFLGFLRTR